MCEHEHGSIRDGSRQVQGHRESAAQARFLLSVAFDVEGSNQVTRYFGEATALVTRAVSATVSLSVPLFDGSSVEPRVEMGRAFAQVPSP